MFILTGINSSFKSVVGYFLVANLTAEQQTKCFLHVINEVEKLGMEVVHVSTDNHATNTKMFRLLKEKYPAGPQLVGDTSVGDLAHVIRHPLDESRPLYLSFDPCHELKNFRNNHVERPLENNGEKIEFELTEKVFFRSRTKLIRPVRGNLFNK